MFNAREISENIDYTFKNEQLLKQALTHGSITGNKHLNYERLEFLGDRVLGMTIAHLLYSHFPNDKEGELSQRFNRLVCAETVADMALHLNLHKYISAKDNEVIQSVNVLCDVCEAIIGAIYIDSDIDTAITFVEKHWSPLFNKNLTAKKDFKTQLQEFLHKLKLPLPIYEVAEKIGEEHNPLFKIKVSSADGKFAYGEGHNKKEAEQHAAEKLLLILKGKND